MSAAAETKEVVELVVGYTKQMVDALTPIAKQAYEVGLMTLRIDAASVLIPSAIVFIIASIVWFLVIRNISYAHKYAKNANDGVEGYKKKYSSLDDGIDDHINPALVIPGTIFGTVTFLISGFNLISVWTWVKLFSPELWLAHQAVEKLLK